MVFFLKYEFAQPGSNGDKMIVEEENLRWILNVNETKMSLDGSKTRAGGRPAVTFFDPHLPTPCVSAEKSSLSCTGIFGSSAAGECVPPHWHQIPTTAMAVGREKVRVNFIQHFMKTCSRLGCKEVREWPATIGMNKKEGGMNEDEFDKYINNSILLLFPNLEDVPGKRVLLKVDSCPERNGTALLLKARFQVVYLYPGRPNATSVQQETDINCGPFKSVIRTNLKNIASAHFTKWINVLLKASTFGLICYGGVRPDLGVVLENALQVAFDTASNLHSWEQGWHRTPHKEVPIKPKGLARRDGCKQPAV